MAKGAIAALLLPIILTACGPSDFEREKLAFEEKKYNDEQAAKAVAAQKEEEDKQQQIQRWNACRSAALSDYNAEFSIWGEPVPGKPGVRNGPAAQATEMKNRLQRNNEECDRNFPKGISY
jgi:hypothetical protein